MFEGTDLNIAYGLSDDSMGAFDNAPPKPISSTKTESKCYVFWSSTSSYSTNSGL